MHVAAVAILLCLTTGCSTLQVPTSGPSRADIVRETLPANAGPIRVVKIGAEPRSGAAKEAKPAPQFASVFADGPQDTLTIGAGDVVEVSIWEAPPATLFGGVADARSAALGTSRAITLPEQSVNSDGVITVPFAGAILVLGRTPQQVETDITARLNGKANQPQAMVRVTRATSNSVTVVGDVASSVRLPLTPRTERLLDALAAAGGTRNPLSKTTVQLTRGSRVLAMPLEIVVKDPRQNVRLRAGDVVAALFQPLSFTSLGATGRNDEVGFEAQGISLAQALGRIGGLQDARADAKGVYIFRFEEPEDTSSVPQPVIYVADLSTPAAFFAIQNFPVRNKDLIYVANASLTEFQKFANAVFSIAFPLLNTISITR